MDIQRVPSSPSGFLDSVYHLSQLQCLLSWKEQTINSKSEVGTTVGQGHNAETKIMAGR